MIKHLFVYLSLFCFCQTSFAQFGYGNEWINYTQKYYKLRIPKTGLYRIDSTTLTNAGIPLSTINAKNIQLFIKGQEQYVYLKGEQDGVFNTNDYLEFYAEKNDCRFDSLAYTNIARIPNPYKALFNDTNYAFITWNNSLTNKRVTIENDINFNSYPQTNYIYSEKTYNPNTHYANGIDYYTAKSTFDPRFTAAEGYGQLLNGGTLQTNTLSLNSNLYQTTNLPVYLKASVSGIGARGTVIGYDHHIALQYTDNLNTVINLTDTTFVGQKQIYIQKQIASNVISSNPDFKLFRINDAAFVSTDNQIVVHYLNVQYPQTLDMFGQSEFSFFIDDDVNNSKNTVQFQNISIGTNTPIIYDLSNHKYFLSQSAANTLSVVIPNNGLRKKCFISNNSLINSITSLETVNQNGYFINYLNTLNTDSAFVIVANKTVAASAAAYASYRESINGGSHNVILSYVDDLYDQFAFGNEKNPLAIRQFCSFLIDNLPKPPNYLLLFGKSIKYSSIIGNAVNWKNCLVPTMGNPPSDNLYTAGLNIVNSVTPFIPTGRLSVNNDNQGFIYLNKITEHETSLKLDYTNNDWHKRILHFAGGTTLSEQLSLSNFLDIDSSIAVNPHFGGRVFSFKKNSTAPIQTNISTQVVSLFNYGAGVVSFFGHGSYTGFDQAIDNPNSYSNKGKYPFFIANSCYSGDIHTPATNTTGEAFTFIQDKGTVAFLASASIGFSSYLHEYSSEIYRSFTYNLYGAGVGDFIKRTCAINSANGDGLTNITSMDMALEGDPSVRITGYNKPDYKITNASVYFNTQKYADSIGVNVKIFNNGKAITDTLTVRINHLFANGDSATYYKSIKAPYNCDTLTFFIYKDLNSHIGLNNFNVHVDFLNEINESFENNNATNGNVSLLIPGGDVLPVFPYKYAIVPKTAQITLKASTADVFAPLANYKLQLDTSDVFNSPISTTVIASAGGVVEWTVNLPLPDSTVYFWRITKDSTTTNDRIVWRESSFQTIGTKTGWAQAHFHQYKNDHFQYVKYLKTQRKFDFVNDIINIDCSNRINLDNDLLARKYSINADLKHYWRFAQNGWTIAVFDSVTGKPWTTVVPTVGWNPTYGNCNSLANFTTWGFDFGEYSEFCAPNSNPTWQTTLETFLNLIPVNNYVLAYNIEYSKATTYSNSLYAEFEKFGSAKIRTLNDSLPMIIFGKKRAIPLIGSANEIIGTYNSQSISISDSMITRWDNGYVKSEIIGPSSKWGSLHWKYENQSGATSNVTLKVIGIQSNGQQDTIPTINLTNPTFDLYNLNTLIDATVYPQIQLVALMSDNSAHKAPQLKKWQVIYDEVPECAINTKKGFSIINTLQEGENLIIQLPIENIGSLPFTDSLAINYYVVNNSNIITPLPQKLKAKPFNPAQIIIDTIKFNTTNFAGTNQLWVNVNSPTSNKYQLEQHYFNNIARINFNVETDKINPILDVTFDGSHILNGDIVSSKPHILVTLKDENKFFALNDTSNFNVFIKYPNQQTEKRIYFANALQFTPAQLPNNSCKIEWKPEFANDGKYKLIIQASDKARNASGSSDYNIQFEIVTAQTITEVLNYPNPFSTSTRFVFTLTGSELPDIFTIQIMTITGKVVREINKSELGNIHIGRNITQYAWDGKDDFGDKLANGVYLYRVITRYNGQAIEKKATDADSFFKKGIGKLVIMR